MAGKKRKERLPKDHVSEKDIEPKYGYVHGEWDACGGHNWSYIDPENHKNTHYQELKASGSYKTHSGDDGGELTTSLNAGEFRGYTKGGHSNYADGHVDMGGESTGQIQYAGDFGSVSGNRMFVGHKKDYIKVGGDTATVSASSPAQSRHVAGDTTSITNKKDYHVNTEGDQVFAVGKTRIDITKNDHALNVGKNLDIYVKEKGKIETKDVLKTKSGQNTEMASEMKFSVTSKNDMALTSDTKIDLTGKTEIIITADTKITLKVGSSTIEISSSGVEINASSVKVNATGVVDIKGSTTKVQGGGMTAPPTTFS